MFICTYTIYICTYIHIHMYVCVYLPTYVCMYVCMYSENDHLSGFRHEAARNTPIASFFPFLSPL